ncbi:MAG: hypothetical protein AAF828_01490 [Bacteroidota bacterium]
MDGYALIVGANEPLDILPGTALTLDLTCPIFDQQRINRTWSYPFKLSRSARNVRLLAGAGRIDAIQVGEKIKGKLYIEGMPYDDGIIRVTGADRETISVVFQNEAIDLAQNLETQKLRDLDLPVQVTSTLQPVIYFIVERLPGFAAEFWVRINGILYQELWPNVQSWVDLINVDHPGLFTFTQLDGTVAYITMNTIPGIDQLFIETIPDREFNPDTQVRRAFLQIFDLNYTEEADRIHAAWAALDVESPDNSFRLPTILAPDIYDGKNPIWSGIMNRYDDINEGYLYSRFPAPPENPQEDEIIEGWTDALLPQPRIAVLIEKALDNFGYVLKGTLSDDEELRELLIFNNHDLGIFLRSLGPQFQEDLPIAIGGVSWDEFDWIIPRVEWNLADHCPDLNALQLIELFLQTFAHFATIERGQLRVTAIKDLLVVAPEDWTIKIEQNYSVTYSNKKAIVLDYDRQGDENIFVGQLERQQIGTQIEQAPYTAAAFSVFEQNRDVQINDTTVRMRIPVIDEVGRNQYWDVGNEARIRFFFHRGLQAAGATGRLYPQAGHSRQGFNGAVGKYSMNWLGEGGLYPTWWRSFIRLMNHNRTDRRLVRLTLADLLEIRQWRRVRKYYSTKDGTAVGVVRSVRVKVSLRTGLGLADVTFQLEPS